VSVVSQLMYKFLCLASPKENPLMLKVSKELGGVTLATAMGTDGGGGHELTADLFLPMAVNIRNALLWASKANSGL